MYEIIPDLVHVDDGSESRIVIPACDVFVTDEEFGVTDDLSATIKFNYHNSDPDTYHIFLYLVKPNQSYHEVVSFFDLKSKMFRMLSSCTFTESDPVDTITELVVNENRDSGFLNLILSEYDDSDLLKAVETVRREREYIFFVENFKLEIHISFKRDSSADTSSGRIQVFVRKVPLSDKIHVSEDQSTFEFCLDEYSEHCWQLVNNKGFDIGKHFGLRDDYRLNYPELDEMPI